MDFEEMENRIDELRNIVKEAYEVDKNLGKKLHNLSCNIDRDLLELKMEFNIKYV